MNPQKQFRADELKTSDIYRFMIDCIQPRPIALVSSMSAEGAANLAPFSYFTGVGSNPPTLVFSCSTRRGPNPDKDTLANIRATGDFVVAVVTEDNVERVNQASFEYEHGVSEFDAAHIARFPSTEVKPWCVADSPVNFECKLIQIVPTGTEPSSGNLVIGRIVMIHAREEVLDDGALRAAPEKLQLVGRMGGDYYARTRDKFILPKPHGPDEFRRIEG